ncbi:MAG: hypothetical protein K2P66_02865 [Lachnospiraceae bacterium]|nr:hypothetical protein [Lachnospiraceae bacterium]
MRKFILFLLLLACGSGLTGCLGKSDKADILNITEISGLVTEKGYTEEEFQDNLLGKTRDDIIIAWGDPDGSLFGSFGDVWYLSDESNKQIVVYYDEDRVTERILLEEQLTEQPGTNKMWDRIPMVRVNGKLYYDTGRESTISGRCGNMDGEITSTVDGTEVPIEDDQSNFGSGFGYQYGADDTIEIYMNEKWFVFEYREESE